MVEKNPITAEGAQKLRDELHRRKTVDRPAISLMIGAAWEHGDLKENDEYHAAREKGGFNEGRIKELEDKISRMEIIDVTKLEGSRVVFGATVKLLNTMNDEEVTYRILGADEADLDAGIISVTAPVAKSMLGKEVGDEVKIRTPNGERIYEVLKINFTK